MPTDERSRTTALRLSAQHISQADFATPVEVVRHLLAMQAQDFNGAKWSVGLRTHDVTDADVEAALAAGSIVRSWPMRGTLHFVPAEDLGWMLGLTAHRTIRSAAGRHRTLELDDPEFDLARSVAERVLADGPLGRAELLAAFDAAGLPTAGLRGAHILVWLSVSQVIVFGPVAGKQHTFALYDDWIRSPRPLTGDEALAEFALRYFRSHGPATVRDFAWWSSLTLTDARRGLAAIADQLESDGDRHFAPGLTPARSDVFALPGFDEYLLGYQDRGAALDAEHNQFIVPGNNGMFMPTIVAGGRVIGTWKRTVSTREAAVTATPFAGWTPAQQKRFAARAKRYGSFIGKPARVLESPTA